MLEFDLQPRPYGVAFNLQPGPAETQVRFLVGKMCCIPGIDVERVAEAQLCSPADGGFVIAALAPDLEPLAAIGNLGFAVSEDDLFFTRLGWWLCSGSG